MKDMKKALIIEILLLFTFGVIIAVNVYFWDSVRRCMESISQINAVLDTEPSAKAWLESTREYMYKDLSYAIPCLIALLADFATMALIAVQNFPCFKPLLDKLKAKRDAQKAAKETAAAEKAEADKQARIEQLQNELDELKKNG